MRGQLIHFHVFSDRKNYWVLSRTKESKAYAGQITSYIGVTKMK